MYIQREKEINRWNIQNKKRKKAVQSWSRREKEVKIASCQRMDGSHKWGEKGSIGSFAKFEIQCLR